MGKGCQEIVGSASRRAVDAFSPLKVVCRCVSDPFPSDSTSRNVKTKRRGDPSRRGTVTRPAPPAGERMDSPYSIMHFSIHGREHAFTFKIVLCFMESPWTISVFWIKQGTQPLTFSRPPCLRSEWTCLRVVSDRGWRWTV